MFYVKLIIEISIQRASATSSVLNALWRENTGCCEKISSTLQWLDR